jgi:hypothetical protein
VRLPKSQEAWIADMLTPHLGFGPTLGYSSAIAPGCVSLEIASFFAWLT